MKYIFRVFIRIFSFKIFGVGYFLSPLQSRDRKLNEQKYLISIERILLTILNYNLRNEHDPGYNQAIDGKIDNRQEYTVWTMPLINNRLNRNRLIKTFSKQYQRASLGKYQIYNYPKIIRNHRMCNRVK